MNVSRRRRSRKPLAVIIVLVLVGLIGLGVYRYNRPLPPLQAAIVAPKTAQQAVALPWTQSGQSAISTVQNKVLGQGPAANKPVATASIAKLITILTVLKKYPLQAGQTGPTITMTQADVDRYNYYYALDGSIVPVAAGEQLSEYQMFQAILLPSANNIADSLAIWAYGSLPAYRTAAQDEVNHLGMGRTTVGTDASGFLPSTTSTANDLVLLGEAAAKEPVIAEIASESSAVLPVAGTVYNTNPDLGTDGVTGLKTGTSDQAGNCFLFTADHTFDNGQKQSFVGVVMNSPTEQSRFSEALSLLEATYAGYKDVTIAKAGQHIGTVSSQWGQSVSIAPASDVSEFVWSGDVATTQANVVLSGKTSLTKNQQVGTVIAGLQTIPLDTTGALNPPSLWWRIFHS